MHGHQQPPLPPPPLDCSADHKAAINHDLVDVVMADASDDSFADAVFAEPRTGGAWDYVVNLAAETDLTKGESFHTRTVLAARKLATESARLGVKKFVHVSTGAVYKPSAEPATEAGKLAPWTNVAAASAQAEDAVRSVAGLPWVILRPAVVYGPGDVRGLMPR
jgi:nucleoside-diphosphate-sugar epimerase